MTTSGTKWYKKELIRNLVDMHIPNGEGYLEKFDPAKYAQNIKNSGATVAYIYASNCLGLCFFPTKVGIRHRAAELDIFGETVKECRKLGLGVVGYLNSWGSFVCNEHPEWSVRLEDGSMMRDSERFGNPCPNNPEYADYFNALVAEMVENYDIDGIWIDMVGMWAPVCHCEACKKKFFAEYGKPLPHGDCLGDDGYVEHVRFKGRSIADYAHRIRQTALSIKPHLSVSIQAAGALKYPKHIGVYDMDYFTASDYLAGDFYTDRSGVNAISRVLYKLTDDLPFEFMTSRCTGLEYHTSNKNMNEILCQAYAAIMYKGAFLFIDAIDPDGEMNAEFYKDISVVRERLSPYLPYVDFNETPMRQIAVYFNFDSFTQKSGRVMPSDKPSARFMIKRLQRICGALSSAGLDYDVLTPKSLDELDDYKVIVISSLETMSEDEVSAVRRYVKNGGHLYISGLASLRDDKGVLGEDFALSDVFGVSYNGKYDVCPNYLAPVSENKSLFGSHTKKYPHMLNEAAVKVSDNGGGKALATVTLPVSDVSDPFVFSSAISNPPVIATDAPAIYENHYGKGVSIYSAGAIEGDAHPDSAALFTSLVKYLLGEPDVLLSAPECVDYTVYKNVGGYSIHLLNSQTILPPIPISRLSISVKVGDATIESVTDVSGGNTEWTLKDGVLTVTTDLDVYKLITVRTA